MSRRIESLLPALVVCVVLAATGIFHSWQRIEGIRLSYRLGEVTNEHKALLSRNEHLRLEVATLKAPSRIEALARSELGMSPPRPSQVTVVRVRAEPSNPNTADALARAREKPRDESEVASVAANTVIREEPRG